MFRAVLDVSCCPASLYSSGLIDKLQMESIVYECLLLTMLQNPCYCTALLVHKECSHVNVFVFTESAPVCNSTQYESSSVLRCDLKYRGNWNPDIDLSIQDDNKANVCLSSEQITSHLVIPHSRHRDELRIYYMCTARFSKNGTTPKTFQGETHNYVVGTVARNIPEYSRSTKCNSEYFIST